MLQKIASGFALAFSMLSIIPFFKVHNFYKGINGYAVLFYPLVGFLLGLLLWGVAVFLEGSVPASHL
ncbi:MAG: adenosylcobinamide-GDP ribazoletransferase, partial [Sulfurimonas sp.]